jgi:hypothetical protein
VVLWTSRARMDTAQLLLPSITSAAFCAGVEQSVCEGRWTSADLLPSVPQGSNSCRSTSATHTSRGVSSSSRGRRRTSCCC